MDEGHRCLEHQQYYSGVMGKYIQWLIKSERLHEIKKMEIKYQQAFYKDIVGLQNDARLSHNLAINMVGFECFCDFISVIENSGRILLLIREIYWTTTVRF